MSQNITYRELLDHLRERFGLTMDDLLKILRVPTHPRELRDDIAMRATSDDIESYQRHDKTLTREEAKYVYADRMLKARLAAPK